MNNKFAKVVCVAFALLTMATLFTSCNRGYGCPYELKSVVKVISPIK